MTCKIKEALKDEKSDVPMYQKIKKTLHRKADKAKIDRIIKDERKHRRILKQIVKHN